MPLRKQHLTQNECSRSFKVPLGKILGLAFVIVVLYYVYISISVGCILINIICEMSPESFVVFGR